MNQEDAVDGRGHRDGDVLNRGGALGGAPHPHGEVGREVDDTPGREDWDSEETVGYDQDVARP